MHDLAQNPRMRTWTVSANVAEIEVECDQEPAFCADPCPNSLVIGSGEPLIVNPVGFVPQLTQEPYMGLPKVLVKFDEEGHRRGTSSSSLARVAA